MSDESKHSIELNRRHVAFGLTGVVMAATPFASAMATPTGTKAATAGSSCDACTAGIGEVWWAELITQDIDASGNFYTKVLGWERKPEDSTYTLFKNQKTEAAGVASEGSWALKGVPAGWLVYIQVENVDRAVEKTWAAGGKVLQSPFDLPNGDRLAILKDPGGAAFAVVTPSKIRSCPS